MSNTFNTIPHFKFWCQKVLPLVYDDSLSYMELLCKVVYYLNNIIDDVNKIPEYIKEMLNSEHLEEYIDEIFSEIRIQIARADEGTSETATHDRSVGDLVWLGENLVRIVQPMTAGDKYVEETGEQGVTGNYVKTSVEIELKRIKEELTTEIGSLDDLQTSTKTSIVTAINEVLSTLNDKVGDLDSLDTETKTNLVSAINEVLDTLNDKVGDLDSLDTETKANLVSALNEVLDTLNDKVGNLDALDTETKSNLVAAINEVLGSIVTNTIYVNVKDYGAKGDGQDFEDDAFASALEAVPTGGTLFIPAGTYKLGSKLKLNKQITILGEGQNEGTSIGSTYYGSVLKFSGDGIEFEIDKYYSLGIKNLSLIGSDSGKGIKIIPPSTHVIYNIEISNVSVTHFDIGVDLDGVLITNINHVLASFNRIGFYCHGAVGTTSILFSNCWAYWNTEEGYKIEGGSYFCFDGCASDANGKDGYLFSNCNCITLNGCGSESNGLSGFSATNGSYAITLNGCAAYNNLNGYSGVARGQLFNGESGTYGITIISSTDNSEAGHYAILGYGIININVKTNAYIQTDGFLCKKTNVITQLDIDKKSLNFSAGVGVNTVSSLKANISRFIGMDADDITKIHDPILRSTDLYFTSDVAQNVVIYYEDLAQ